MDIRNLCQNIDIDSIRAKFASLPDMPAMPQIKLPKSLPKLRSRRIFRSSREDVSRGSSKKPAPAQQQPPPIPPANFINHSPRRISTIASLMNEDGTPLQGTYCSARSIEDDYSSPRQFHRQTSRPISPVRMPGANAETSAQPPAKMSLTERLQKGYKDMSEFRLKHIFAKKTVVRKDNIQVDHYVARYNEDRVYEQQEEEQRNRQIAENYRFNFKVSRQNTGHTDSLSSHDSPVSEPKGKTVKSVSAQSGDESGMEVTPPKRKPGIASTRFANVRKPPLKLGMSEESNEPAAEQSDDETPPKPERNQSALWSLKGNYSSPETKPTAEVPGRGMKTLTKLRNLGKRNEEAPEVSAEKKRKAPLTPQQSEEQEENQTAGDTALSAIKQNIKRFQKSIKRQSSTVDESEDENAAKETKQVSKTEKLTARLRKMTSRDSSVDNLDSAKESPKKAEDQKSPIRTAITNKIQNWKKSFKKRPTDTEATNTGDETSPEKEKRSDTIIKRLKHIRSRKNPGSTDDLDVDDDEDASPSTSKSKDTKDVRKSTNFEERFEQARQRTIKKVNEKMQHIKFFHKSQEHIDKEDSKKPKTRSNNDNKSDEEDDSDNAVNVPPTIARRGVPDDSPTHSEQDDIEEINNIHKEYALQKTRTIWTTRNLLSDSLDSETDSELPRVLIHQDNSDVFESTLIIAVTRPASQSPTPKITEITPEKRTPTPTTKPVEWIPNTEIISSFLEITPPSKRRLSCEAIMPAAATRGHARKLSMDSNSDSDSWIPETVRSSKPLSQNKDGSPLTALNSIDESEEPWKIHSKFHDKTLYKTKSIDIFEKNAKQGGVSAAFEDFDDVLKDEPIVRIPQHNVDSFEKDSSEEPDTADDDNSSRVTKILVTVIQEEREEEEAAMQTEIKPTEAKLILQAPEVPTRQLGNSCENTINNSNENNKISQDDEDDDFDRPPSGAPSPPPSMSPPPPPLPKRKPSVRMPKPSMEPPPLPTSKPPLPTCKPAPTPPQIPERTPSMTRIARPLVKTSSLRLAYNEQVKPSDVGKVNKLISRFEQPPPNATQRPRIIPRRSIHDDSDEEYSDDDEEDEAYDDDDVDAAPSNARTKYERDTTPTPTNTPRMNSVDSNESFRALNIITTSETTKLVETKTTSEITKSLVTYRDGENNARTGVREYARPAIDVPKISLSLDNNSNASFSRPSSEYGSPLSSLFGSTETTPIPDRRPHDVRSAERSRRSMTRDDDKFLSFDSDEENSYYSISSSGSSRYVVEI